MRKTKFLLILPLIIFFILGIVFLWWTTNTVSVSGNDQSIRFVIPKGMGATQIGYKLRDAGLIKNPLVFKIYTQITGKSGSIQAGEFSLKKNLNLYQLVSELLKGPSLIWVTIPEGLRKEEVALRIAKGLELDGYQENDFVTNFISLSSTSEGKLYPDTYLFPRDITPQKALMAMTKLFDTLTKELKIEQSKYSFEEIVTVASLIEREAKGDAERPVIAGIIYKRLENDWPLQIDASIQYQKANQALKNKNVTEVKYWGGLTKEDIETPSIYNTYKNLGLPPTPICNPGIASIKAAVSPQDTEYWFYLHDTKGQIHYADSLEEHNSNIRKYLNK